MLEAITGFFNKAKESVVGTSQDAVAPVQKAIPVVATQGGAVKLGMGKEPAGYTSAGGRRLKTRSASRGKKGGARKTRSASRKGGRKH